MSWKRSDMSTGAAEAAERTAPVPSSPTTGATTMRAHWCRFPPPPRPIFSAQRPAVQRPIPIEPHSEDCKEVVDIDRGQVPRFIDGEATQLNCDHSISAPPLLCSSTTASYLPAQFPPQRDSCIGFDQAQHRLATDALPYRGEGEGGKNAPSFGAHVNTQGDGDDDAYLKRFWDMQLGGPLSAVKGDRLQPQPELQASSFAWLDPRRSRHPRKKGRHTW